MNAEQDSVVVNPVYEVFRAVALTILIPMASLFWYQMYLDRKELMDRELWPKAHRVFRVGGWLGTTVGIVAHADFFGVLGVYSPFVPSVMFSVVLNSIGIPMFFAWYLSATASCAFLLSEARDRITRGAFIVFIIMALNTVLTIVSAVTQSAITRFVNSIVLIPSLVIMCFGVNYLHFTLRRHLKEMAVVDNGIRTDSTSSSNNNALRHNVRTWFKYAIALTILSLVMIPIFGIRVRESWALIDSGELRYESNINTIDSPADAPPASMIALIAVTLLIPLVFLWKSWRTVDSDMPRSSRTRSRGTKWSTANSTATPSHTASVGKTTSRRTSMAGSVAATRASTASVDVDVRVDVEASSG